MNEQTEIFYEDLVLNKAANSLEIRISFDPVIQGGGTYSLQCKLYTASNSGCSKLTYTSPWENSGNLSFSITPERPTVYGVGVRSMTERPGRQTIYGTPDVEYNVYVDGDLYTTKWTISHSGVGIPIDPFFGKVYLNSGHTPTERVSYNNTASASAKKGDENLCTAIIGNLEKDFLTTTITKGSEYLSFYDAVTGSLIGDSYREDINGIYANLKYDTPYYGTEDYQAEITTEVNGYTKSATFKLIPEECGGDALPCSNSLKFPTLITKRTYIQPICSDPNIQDLGQTVTNGKNNSYIVNTCFNDSTNTWQYSIVGDKLEFFYQSEVCTTKIKQIFPNVLESLNDVNNIKIPSSDSCIAFKNFESQKIYGGDGTNIKYFILNAVTLHEDEHIKEFKNIINEIADELDFYNLAFKPQFFNCNMAKTKELAQIVGEKNIENALKMLNNKIAVKRKLTLEQDTQNKANVPEIERYIKKLEMLYKVNKTTCI